MAEDIPPTPSASTPGKLSPSHPPITPHPHPSKHPQALQLWKTSHMPPGLNLMDTFKTLFALSTSGHFAQGGETRPLRNLIESGASPWTQREQKVLPVPQGQAQQQPWWCRACSQPPRLRGQQWQARPSPQFPARKQNIPSSDSECQMAETYVAIDMYVAGAIHMLWDYF